MYIMVMFFSGFLLDSLSHSEVAVAQEVIYLLEGGWFDSWLAESACHSNLGQGREPRFAL